MDHWELLLGGVLGAPLWILLTLWVSRRLWRTMRRLSARAKGREQLVELGQLAGGLAHEIKNPLSTVTLNLKLLSEDLAHVGGQDARRLQVRLDGVRREADRLREILEDFLRYAGKYELQMERVDLRRLVEELADFFAPQAEAARVVMRVALSDEPVACQADPNLLKQAILNLMINATQAMPAGGELLIRVGSHRGRGQLEVIDTGPGIPPDQIGRIFEVYYSTKKHGTGLGLPTTWRIVREHGGTISVQSEPGRGTRVVIDLPLAKDREPT